MFVPYLKTLNIKVLLLLVLSILISCNNQEEKVPQWADFFSDEEYRYFMEIVEKHFADNGDRVRINEDGMVAVDNNEYGVANLYLVNMAQLCLQANQTEWPTIIKKHFESMKDAAKFDAEFNKNINNFEKNKQYLGVTIYNKSNIEIVGKENVIYRKIADDLIELLVFDLPNNITNVHPDKIKSWGKQKEELFGIASDNFKKNYEYAISEQKFGDFKLWFVQSDHMFSGNILLDKLKLKEYIGSNGALIGIPQRHAVLIYPIENKSVKNAINLLIPTISGMYREGPGSISSKLYWYHNATFINLDYQYDGKNVVFSPPKQFVEMLLHLK